MMGTLDDRGRLFVCESSGNTLNDQQMAANPDYLIRMLEDRDGEGIFDHATRFRRSPDTARRRGLVSRQPVCGIAARCVPLHRYRWRRRGRPARGRGDGLGDGVERRQPARAVFRARWLAVPHRRPPRLRHQDQGWPGVQGQASRIWRVRPDGTGLEWLAGGGFDNPVELVFTPAGETIGTMTYFKDPANGERDALLHFVEGGVYPKWYP